MPRKKVIARFGFTIDKDLALLKSALKLNPWEFGEESWNEITNEMSKEFPGILTKRTVKNRIDLLVKKYESESLCYKTGTEEEQTERGSLLEEITGLIAASKVPINSILGSEEGNDSNQNSGGTVDPLFIPVFSATEVETVTGKKTAAPKRKEKQDADQEREEILENMDGFAPTPNICRKKRQRLCLEDEMIKKKQEHDMNLDLEKLQLEKNKLSLEEKKEQRLTDENKRRDDLAASQMQFQNQLMQIFQKIIDK